MLFASFFLLATFLLTIQTALFPFFPSWAGNPDLLFLLVVFLAYKVDIINGAILVFLIGFLIDIVSGFLLGLYPTIYLIVFFLLKTLSKHIALNDSAYQAPFAVISYLFSMSAIYILSSILAPLSILEWSWRTMLLQTLLLAIISIPFFSLMDLYMTFSVNKLGKWRLIKTRGGNRFRS